MSLTDSELDAKLCSLGEKTTQRFREYQLQRRALKTYVLIAYERGMTEREIAQKLLNAVSHVTVHNWIQDAKRTSSV